MIDMVNLVDMVHYTYIQYHQVIKENLMVQI